MKKILAAAGLSALLLGFLATPAFAHAELDKKQVEAGKEVDLVLKVPAEIDGVANAKVSIELPEGFAFRNCIATGNWACSYSKAENPTRDVITWAPVPGNEQGIETFQFRVEAGAHRGDVKFEVNQTYANGEVVNWDGDEDSEHPAAIVEVVGDGEATESADEGEMKATDHTEGESGHSDETMESSTNEGGEAVATDEMAAEEDKDDKGINWGLFGLVVGLMLLAASQPIIASARTPNEDHGDHH